MPNNSLAHQPSEYTGPENSFVFETLSPIGLEVSKTNKTIFANKALKKFDSLRELDLYLDHNPQITLNPSAGIAGYINYEGDLEFFLFDEILSGTNSILESDINHEQLNCSIVSPPANEFITAIKKCQQYIKEGEIYQANLSQKFLIQNFTGSGIDLYKKLKLSNPAPYAGYMNTSRQEIISSSPESFLKIKRVGHNWRVTSSPIKGTAKSDQENKLIRSEKEQAEHIMIVDLIRNDLGKICQPGSLRVENFLSSHKFKNLNHLISDITGVLANDQINTKINQPIFEKIFNACHPGGSITGAPKKRAIEIISELEPCPRGAYTGCMGYYKFSGEGEFSILIRTIILDKINQELSFHSGAGITSSSDPQKELEEIYLKAEKLAEALGANIYEHSRHQ
jgi:anthranilate/para-aminobenzoate synthase component I